MKEAEEQLCEAARKGDTDRVKALINSGADVTYFDGEGLNPLMHAAKLGHAPVLSLLLSAGAPWNALSPSNLSAGDYAMQEAHSEAFELLLNAGIQAELILGTIARKDHKNGDSGDDYLEDRVSFSEDKLMDADSKAVMMAWEKPLMEAHAKAVCSGGAHVLNIGFGMGLVDSAIQQYSPASHTIVEAHPEVYQRMLRSGWGQKENVKIVFGRWQDVLSQLQTYDGIFFDTYGEYYDDLREFHQHLPTLLKPGGIYSFFNGLCGSNAFFHVVYCHLVSLELENLGYSTQLIPLPVKDCLGEQVWEGVKQKYWQLDTYYLPVCQSVEEPE
ncbi:protein arginine N-methyltransferase 2 [Cajanus cajan]|uniref:Protein arginine N-methyltransferase 2 n=1 Tax=Cajanus cajan TaxID=3821 RepID=A0A151TTN3_CAJCA|nr:protein arginine N-methyltransferase 2 [Cajanus cajan]KYP70420.1 Arginine N-methyltransferase 2 [Cajanus cajan]